MKKGDVVNIACTYDNMWIKRYTSATAAWRRCALPASRATPLRTSRTFSARSQRVVNGTAPALRGGASGGTAPALRGGASLWHRAGASRRRCYAARVI